METRDAQESDIEACHFIYNHYVQSSLATLAEASPSLSEMQKTFTNLTSQDYPFLVSQDPSTHHITGFAYGGPYNERSGYRFSAEDSVYVHPDHCGKGIGRRLLELVLDRLRTAGKTQVLAKISIEPGLREEEVPSIKLHLGMGFRVVGRTELVGFKLGKWVDVVTLQMAL